MFAQKAPAKPSWDCSRRDGVQPRRLIVQPSNHTQKGLPEISGSPVSFSLYEDQSAAWTCPLAMALRLSQISGIRHTMMMDEMRKISTVASR